jgi:hypothetical protein
MANDPTVATVDPANPTGPLIQAVFPGWWLRKLFKTSPVDFKNIVAAKFVLENVERVFRGPLHFRQGGWCYTGRPLRWCIRAPRMTP